MMVTTGGRGTPSLAAPSSPAAASETSLAACSSKVITLVSAPKKRAISLASSVSSVWLMVANTPRASKRAIKSLARIPSFSARSLTLTAFRDRDAARDRLRLVRERQPRRRRVALHRAFLHATRNIALSGPARWAHPDGCRASRARRRQAPGPTPSGRVPVGDCRVGCIGRRSPGRNGGRHPEPQPRRAGTLKNWLAWHRTSGSGTRRGARALARLAQRAEPAPCTPDAVQSAERSCAAAALADALAQSEPLASQPLAASAVEA